MTKVTDTDVREIQEDFPDLYYDASRNSVRGEMSFRAHYDGKYLHLNPRDQTKPKQFSGCYDVEISLDRTSSFGFPVVWEVGGKIARAARRHKVDTLDMHLNGDGSCCLSVFLPIEPANFTFSRFVRELVFGYFAWHAYLEVFGTKPPWGEYSHDKGQYERSRETLSLGRNDPCFCGSGRKYKHCCRQAVENSRRIRG